MRITIAHFGTHYVDMPGGVEKLTCYLSSDLVKKGYDVTVLYRDGIEGKPHFPIDSKVRQLNILFENGHKVVSEKLPFTLRVYRELARLFSQKKAQGINAEFKGRQYGPRIRRFLNEYPADVILSCSAPSTKYVITNADYQGPVITMFRGDPAVQMPPFFPMRKERQLLKVQPSRFSGRRRWKLRRNIFPVSRWWQSEMQSFQQSTRPLQEKKRKNTLFPV